VIIDDTHYYVMEGDSYHRPFRIRSNINCSFVEPQHTIVTKNFLPRFKYDKSKVEKYQLALTTTIGNLWIVELIRHLGVDELVDLLQQCVGAVAKNLLLVASLRKGTTNKNTAINPGLTLTVV
jgi:hypothetical protein